MQPPGQMLGTKCEVAGCPATSTEFWEWDNEEGVNLCSSHMGVVNRCWYDRGMTIGEIAEILRVRPFAETGC